MVHIGNIVEVENLPAIHAVSSKGYAPGGIQLLPNLQGLRMNNRGSIGNLAIHTPERYVGFCWLARQQNCAKLNIRRRLGIACNYSTANRTWSPPSSFNEYGLYGESFFIIKSLTGTLPL